MENNITLNTQTTESKKDASSVFTILLVIFVIVLVVVSGFIGNHFQNVFIFSLMFGFPLLILYRNDIANYLPKNIANYVVKESESGAKKIQTVTGQVNPVYSSEIQLLFLGFLSVFLSEYFIIRRGNEFIGIASSVFFTIVSLIFLVDLF